MIRILHSEGMSGIKTRLRDRRKRLISFAYHHLLLYQMDPEAELPHSPAHVQIAQVRPEDPQAIRELAHIYRVPIAEHELLNRLFQNECCYLGKVNDEPVGYVWIHHTDDVKAYGRTILRLKADEVYDHDVYVLPYHRVKNI